MIRPAHPRRLAVRTAVAAATCLLAVACSTGPGPSSNSSPAHDTPARLTYTPPDDPVRMLFPATGAETRWTQGLNAFGQQVAHTVAASCARDSGIGLPEQAPPAFIPFSGVPDLEFIARHGFGYSAEIPAPATDPAPTRSGSPTTVRRCLDEGASAGRGTHKADVSLQKLWFRELASLRHDPDTIRALGTLPGCFAEHGFQVRDENTFLGLVDSRLLSASSADFPRINRELGRAYATCLRPVEAVREPARLRLRTRFLTQHADQVDELRRNLVPSLHRAERRYGVRLMFPAP